MNEGLNLLNKLQSVAKELCATAKMAHKHGKSLGGDGFYGKRFHTLVVHFSSLESALSPHLCEASIPDEQRQQFDRAVSNLKSTRPAKETKADALKSLELLSATTLGPRLELPSEEPKPKTEAVLPLAVVKGSRGYLENVVTQANACYEARCFDACSVMIRKLVEILVIEVYESKKRAADIQNSAGDFLMLRDLITKILTDTQWTLARESKRSLPELKSLGDRSAHNRRYLATKADVDRVVDGLRVVVDDLLHLSGLK